MLSPSEMADAKVRLRMDLQEAMRVRIEQFQAETGKTPAQIDVQMFKSSACGEPRQYCIRRVFLEFENL